jgi:hypothetical protein
VGPGAGLDRCGKSRPTGIRSPDLPARSESLYRPRYPGSLNNYKPNENVLQRTTYSCQGIVKYVPSKYSGTKV